MRLPLLATLCASLTVLFGGMLLGLTLARTTPPDHWPAVSVVVYGLGLTAFVAALLLGLFLQRPRAIRHP